jgi:hypothetical protein
MVMVIYYKQMQQLKESLTEYPWAQNLLSEEPYTSMSMDELRYIFNPRNATGGVMADNIFEIKIQERTRQILDRRPTREPRDFMNWQNWTVKDNDMSLVNVFASTYASYQKEVDDENSDTKTSRWFYAKYGEPFIEKIFTLENIPEDPKEYCQRTIDASYQGESYATKLRESFGFQYASHLETFKESRTYQISQWKDYVRKYCVYLTKKGWNVAKVLHLLNSIGAHGYDFSYYYPIKLIMTYVLRIRGGAACMYRRRLNKWA